ncbi:MAG: protein kinase [Verrucomicrobiota bacterium]
MACSPRPSPPIETIAKASDMQYYTQGARIRADCMNVDEPGGPEQFGPYYLQELINSGGMADIWFVTNQKNEPFALRRLRDNSFFSFTAKKRFVRGCEILSQIHNHENVIGYVEHGKINGLLYLVMEYVEASNLKLLFARNDPVLLENVANILIDMAVALEHVHDSGFMHLDFKPENVLVTRNASIRLVDFDLAQVKPPSRRRCPTTQERRLTWLPSNSSDNPSTIALTSSLSA